MQMGWLIDLFVFVSKIFHHKLRESPASFSCEIPETIARRSPIKISNTTHPLYTAQHHSHSYSHHFTINSTVVIIFRFSCFFFIYCGFPLLLESSASLSILRVSYTEAAAAAILRYLYHYVFSFDVSHQWNRFGHSHFITIPVYSVHKRAKKSHSFLFLPLVRYSNMVYSTIFSLSSSTSLLGCNSNDFHQKPPLPQFDCWASDMLTMRWTSINK